MESHSPVTPTPSTVEPDWLRLQKALTAEADRGFNDIEGKQYRFSQFLSLSLSQPPAQLPALDQERWQDLGQQFTAYADMTFAQRQHLVADARRFLHEARKRWQGTGDRGQGTGDRGQGTGNRGQGTGNREQGTGVREQGSGNREQGTGNREQGTGDRGQGTGNREQGTGDRGQGAGNRGQGTGKERAGSLIALEPIHSSGRVIALEQSITYLPGIGPKNAERLAKLGLYTVRDLLYYYPRDHIDYAHQVNIRDLAVGETVTLVGTVKRCNCFTSPRNTKLTILELVVRDATGQIKLSRFFAGNRFSRAWQEQQKQLYAPGRAIAASGLVKHSKYGVTLEEPMIEVLEQAGKFMDSLTVGRVVPIYPLTEGVPIDLVRRAVKEALPAVPQIQEALPENLRQKCGLVGVQEAIGHLHFPPDPPSLEAARHRLVFDEFFYLQLGMLKRRKAEQATQASAVLIPTGELIDRFYQMLPFQLTQAQNRVINDILHDLQQPTPMNRLVQGDVGSGKTVVAVIAMMAAIQSGYQVAMMAPTEVLAEQHYRKLVQWLTLLHLPVELLTGSTKTAKRREIYTQLETGELPVLVGTHALIQDTVTFQRLGLVVIDEQHRFGVQQRARLQQKGEHPHVLTMTATPIPRTLALTLHGDLDVSQIDELPPGRKPIQTTVLTGRQRLEAYDLIRREIAQGRQVYVVLPLVEESEKLDLKSAIEEHLELQERVFPEFQVGLLHGRMTSAEKDEAITRFRNNETQLLVSTTVIEVGVDVPNATVMLIEHGERFGLAQLHQLRGRVGRGANQSFCLLMNGSRSETARQRLRVMEQSQDGFFISEMDLRFRGPGEVLGTRQSGLPDFALASLVDDQTVLEQAREAAEQIIAKDATLERWPALRQELQHRYQRLMGGAIFT